MDGDYPDRFGGGYGLHIPFETFMGMIPGTSWNKERKQARDLKQAQLYQLLDEMKHASTQRDLASREMAVRERGAAAQERQADAVAQWHTSQVEQQKLERLLTQLGVTPPTTTRKGTRPVPKLFGLMTGQEQYDITEANPEWEPLARAAYGLLGLSPQDIDKIVRARLAGVTPQQTISPEVAAGVKAVLSGAGSTSGGGEPLGPPAPGQSPTATAPTARTVPMTSAGVATRPAAPGHAPQVLPPALENWDVPTLEQLWQGVAPKIGTGAAVLLPLLATLLSRGRGARGAGVGTAKGALRPQIPRGMGGPPSVNPLTPKPAAGVERKMPPGMYGAPGMLPGLEQDPVGRILQMNDQQLYELWKQKYGGQ